jgi:ribonuclease HI
LSVLGCILIDAMLTTLSVYTDASVKGDFVARRRRRRIGPAMSAWAAWGSHDCDSTPMFIGSAYVGIWGTQGAEYQAIIHGLAATLAWFKSSPEHGAIEVAVYCDNAFVVNQINGHFAIDRMRPLHDHTKELMTQVEDHVLALSVVKADGDNPGHKCAHGLSKRAWDTVLDQKHWRPQSRYVPPPALAEFLPSR